MSGVICGIAEWIELILCVDVAHLYLTVGPAASFFLGGGVSAFFLDCPLPLTRSEVTDVGGEQKAAAAVAARQDVRQKVGQNLHCCLFLFIYFPVLMAGDPDF